MYKVINKNMNYILKSFFIKMNYYDEIFDIAILRNYEIKLNEILNIYNNYEFNLLFLKGVGVRIKKNRLGLGLGKVEKYSESLPMLTNNNIVCVGDRGLGLGLLLTQRSSGAGPGVEVSTGEFM